MSGTGTPNLWRVSRAPVENNRTPDCRNRGATLHRSEYLVETPASQYFSCWPCLPSWLRPLVRDMNHRGLESVEFEHV